MIFITEFERTLVSSLNSHFQAHDISALAYRLKQSRFATQFLDVLVDSLNPDLYMGIECKSISVDKGASALYFSQHFTVDKHGKHQVERIGEYLKQTGRQGFLAVELRNGVGKGRQAYLIPWQRLEKLYRSQKRLTVDEIQNYHELTRKGTFYSFQENSNF